MTTPVNPRRSYDSSRRRQQAQETRRRVLDVARERFLADGYAATTVATVAADAGVSVETVYKAFGNKPGLLKAMFDVAVGGDDEDIPLLEREEVRRNMAEPDPRKKLRDYGAFFVQRSARAVPVQLVARDAAASDPTAADVWAQMQAERLTGMGHFARHLKEGRHLRRGVTVEQAQDVLWTFTSPEIYELLVLQRGWAPERYGTWMADMLIAALLS